MDYWASITVPKDISKANPIREAVKVCPGVVKHLWLFFPKGHKGTTKVRILRHEHQVWPTNPTAWYLGDGTVIEFDESYSIEQPPYEFILESYNTSILHSHTTYCRFTILAAERPVIPLPPRRVAVF